MSVNLDKIDYKNRGLGRMTRDLLSFEKYLKQAQEIAENFALPSYFINCNKIVFVGMGASGIAGKIIKNLAKDSKMPIEIVSDYKLPAFVDKSTLVIALSHSGDTEETLSSFVDGYQKGAKLLAISTGGKIAGLCRKFSVSCIEYQLDSEPKLAIGYLLLIPYILLSKIGATNYNKQTFEDTLILLNKQTEKLCPDCHSATNPAKDLSLRMNNKIIQVIGSTNISSLAERFAQAINEDSKNFASFAAIPEMNHNLIAGLDHPKDKTADLFLLSLESKFSSTEIKKRENITSSILDKKRIDHLRISFPEAIDQLSEIILAINFIGFTTLYLAVINKIDPISSETVDLIKSQMAKN
jgi:glucose/mannose-6-phosphate isomerase